ncbi:MAG: hypothetical protein KDA24_19840 [Deltaproteobacteria bacterium]|nr:hypothetical protein [Deltaproteobacteria bacterium]
MRPLALLVLAGAMLLPSLAEAGPWTPDPGAGYAKVQARWLPGIGFFAEPGAEPQVYGIYNEVFLGGFYAEVGLAPRTSVSIASDGVRLFFLQDPRDKSVSSHASFGEPTLTVTLQPVQAGRFALSVAGFIRVPGAPNTPVADVVGIADGHPVIGELRVGTGILEGGGTLSMGAGLGRLYLAGSVGALARGGGWDSVLQWSAEAGLAVGMLRRTQLRLRIAGFHPLKNGTAPYHASPSGIGNGTAYTGFTLEVERWLTERLAAGFSIAGAFAPVVRQTGGPVITGYLAVKWP